MKIEDCWPTLLPVYDTVKAHFAEKNKQPFFFLAGQNSGKTVLANVLMEEYYTAGKAVFIAAVTLNQALRNSEIYSSSKKKRPIEYISCTPRAGENLEKRFGVVNPGDLLVVEDYEWIAYTKVDRIIDIFLARGADVLILSAQGIHVTEKKYTPTVKYSTWELNPVMNESNYLFLKNYATFERDYGGGRPYPY